MEFGSYSVTPPTKLRLSGTAKIDDIIVPTFRSAGDENCYIKGWQKKDRPQDMGFAIISKNQ
jgi:hypothetical protein